MTVFPGAVMVAALEIKRILLSANRGGLITDTSALKLAQELLDQLENAGYEITLEANPGEKPEPEAEMADKEHAAQHLAVIRTPREERRAALKEHLHKAHGFEVLRGEREPMLLLHFRFHEETSWPASL
jgi:hypothetical protein